MIVVDGSHCHVHYFRSFCQGSGKLEGRTVAGAVYVFGVGTYVIFLSFGQRSQFQAEVVSCTFGFHKRIVFEGRGRGGTTPTDSFFCDITSAISLNSGIYGCFRFTYSGDFGDGNSRFIRASQSELGSFAVECTVACCGISGGIVSSALVQIFQVYTDSVSLTAIHGVLPICCRFGRENTVTDTFLRNFYTRRHCDGTA
ncbi:unknown [Bacteroides cellulosilyticus CAG:158]|nr:unknown [Bacteroides cellulosilyticus CAG:158]